MREDVTVRVEGFMENRIIQCIEFMYQFPDFLWILLAKVK